MEDNNNLFSENINENTVSEDTAPMFEELSPEAEDNDVIKIIKKEKHAKRKSHIKKRKGVLKSILWVAAIFAISITLATVLIVGTGEFLGIGPGRGRDIVVEIDEGMSTRKIAERLKEAGAINSEIAFRIYSKLTGLDSKYLYGVYSFNNEIGYEELTEILTTMGTKASAVTVTIPEMATIDEMGKILEEKKVCTAKDFLKAVNYGEINNKIIEKLPAEKVYYRLEGYLFPDTYNFYCYEEVEGVENRFTSEECAEMAVKKMLDKMESVLNSDNLKKAESMGYSVHEILTMASIVESESSNASDEMPKVAAVFYNRLKSADFTRLQSSPSSKYPYGNGRYDTYKCLGLPPGPICAPSLNAINAALNPTADFDYYYFVSDAKMEFHFNKTLNEHNSTIAKLKRENNWIGDL